MIVLPAIDLKDHQVVRLRKGEFDTVHRVAEDPLQTARAFAAAGAKYIHMVDLDGARSGARKNEAEVRAVAEHSGLKVELGGGLRTLADLEAADAMGVTRMVIGLQIRQGTQAAVERYGERIAVGIDARDGVVKTAGWEDSSGLDYLDFAASMEQIGVKIIIFTDIETDGMLTGPSWECLESLQRKTACRIIASGGVSSNEDIRRLRDMGLYGAIVGKAYYTGAVDLARAVKEAGEQC